MAVFEVTRQVRRRLALAADLPTDSPVILAEIDALVDDLPDPALLCAEERAGSMAAVARLRDRWDAYLTDLAAVADAQDDARVLHAGTAGTLVAVTTGQNPQTGSAIVARGAALQQLPAVHAAFRAGSISAAHVGVITAESPQITGFADIEDNVVTIAERVEPAELRRLLRLLADQCRPEARDDQAAALHAKRSLSLSETSNGMFRLDGYLDPVEGARLRDALVALMPRTGRDDLRTPSSAEPMPWPTWSEPACPTTVP